MLVVGLDLSIELNNWGFSFNLRSFNLKVHFFKREWMFRNFLGKTVTDSKKLFVGG